MSRTGYIDADIHLVACLLVSPGSALSEQKWLCEGPNSKGPWLGMFGARVEAKSHEKAAC